MSAWAMPRRCFMPCEKPLTLEPATLAQVDDVEHFVDALLVPRPAHAAQHAQVAARRHARVKGGVLNEAAHVARRLAPLPRHAMAEDLGVAGGREDQAQAPDG